jgi:hypothetical protein
VSLQRKLGEGSFAEVTAGSTDAEAVLSGRALTRVSSARVQIGLFYGQLGGSGLAGTRVLVKAYSPSDQPPWAEEPTEDVRARLEAALAASSLGGGSSDVGGGGSGGGGGSSGGKSLEASYGSGKSGAGLAEALALNEFAAHSRVQRAPAEPERRGLARLIGRLVEKDEGGSPLVLHAFPWRGEDVRMALPTRLPPTLGSWMMKCEAGETDGQKKWKGVPVQAATQRGRFARAALRGALRGLDELHRAGLVHQARAPPWHTQTSSPRPRSTRKRAHRAREAHANELTAPAKHPQTSSPRRAAPRARRRSPPHATLYTSANGGRPPHLATPLPPPLSSRVWGQRACCSPPKWTSTRAATFRELCRSLGSRATRRRSTPPTGSPRTASR